MKRLLLVLPLITLATPAFARDQIRIVGSSTVYPFVTAAAEQFGSTGKFKMPIVESTGTGGGFKLFCEGVGERFSDINNASRQMTQSEKKLCAKNGITNVHEFPIGYDGIVMAFSAKAPKLDLSRKQIFLALAKQVPDKDGKLIPNPYKKWSEIDASLPDKNIEVYGPPPTSGTRDAFVELVIEKGCEEFPEFDAAYKEKDARKHACKMLREDGHFIQAGEDDNLIVQKLVSNESALGVLGYGFMEENKTKVQGSLIEGVEPSMENIENDSYKIARSMFIYVKGEHIGQVPGIKEFLMELISDSAIGREGYLVSRGLLPLHDAEFNKARQSVKKL